MLKKFDLWELGFRPFFLFGSLHAVVIMFMWVAYQDQWISVLPFNNPVYWHFHEIIYGFVLAIVSGFLLTASPNWTGMKGITGNNLIFLFSIWGLGRLFSFLPWLWVYSFFDLLYLPILCVYLFPFLSLKTQKRNWIFFGLFFLLWGINIIFHLEFYNILVGHSLKLSHFTIYIIVLMVIIIGGRILPFFSSRVILNIKFQSPMFIEKIVIGSSIGYFLLKLILGPSLITGLLGLIPLVCHSTRFLAWKPWTALRIPILLILHIGYFWIPLGFLMSIFHDFGILNQSLMIHSFTSGVIGIFIYGMITRISLGHTGRPIKASPSIIVGYILISIVPFFRVIMIPLFPSYYSIFVHLSGHFFAIAFVIFLWKYTPILIQKRVQKFG